MVNSTDGHNAQPGPRDAEDFFASLFEDQRKKGVPITGYEVDFLADQTSWFPYLAFVVSNGVHCMVSVPSLCGNRGIVLIRAPYIVNGVIYRPTVVSLCAFLAHTLTWVVRPMFCMVLNILT